MNRWTGTGHLTKDPKLLETDGGTAICTLRVAVKRAGEQGIERELTTMAELEAILTDYLQQAETWDAIPAAGPCCLLAELQEQGR
jgi:hypothetical protein